MEQLMKQGFSLSAAQRMMTARKIDANMKREISALENKITQTEGTDLKDVKGIGPSTIQVLLENGIKTKEDLKAVNPDKIKELIKSPIALKAINNI